MSQRYTWTYAIALGMGEIVFKISAEVDAEYFVATNICLVKAMPTGQPGQISFQLVKYPAYAFGLMQDPVRLQKDKLAAVCTPNGKIQDAARQIWSEIKIAQPGVLRVLEGEG